MEGRLPAPGTLEVSPPVTLLVAHDARISEPCCDTYPCNRLVALGSGRWTLLANIAAAAEIIDGLLNSEGDAAAGFGT
jgi:hypothetical protein